MRLLLVDDSDAIERYVRAVAEPAGWTVDRAANGNEALLRARAAPADAILLDFVLPDQDGLDVLDALFEAGVRAPVIVLSAAQSPDVMKRFAHAGASDYLAKDEMTPARLRTALRMAHELGSADPPVRLQRPRGLRGTPEEEGGPVKGASTATILIIDDTASFRALVRGPLTAIGWRVIEAPDGETGIGLAETARPDVVLLDHVLPDAQGLEILRMLREADLTVPVVALTGHGDEALAEAFLSDGAVDYLSKETLTIPRLVFALERAMWVGRADVQVKATR